MESDKKKQLKTVIEYFAYAAIVIQTAFAAFWLFKNIGVIKLDYVAHTYILAAESLKVDDSMGILYALLVRAVGHGVLLQELQHVALTAAVFFFSLSLFERKAGVIIALMVSYNPLILQAAMAVSPNALVLACGLVAIAAGVKAFKDKKWIWVLSAFLLLFIAEICQRNTGNYPFALTPLLAAGILVQTRRSFRWNYCRIQFRY